ncbi:hypothetical protein JCM8202_004465 [Rhodotorula sphaerocarpa]
MLDKMLRLDPASRANSQSDALATPDVLTLDLEDSVRMEKKSEARRMVTQALQASASTDSPSRKFVRINPGQAGLDDLDAILSAPGLDGLLLPKVNSAADVQAVTRFIDEYGSETYRRQPRVIASIESPLGLLNLREIATSERVGGLLFAAEDYCASSRLIRTPSRLEMLYARSCVVAAAHAFGLSAIDLVCVKYKGEEAERILVEEAEEGRRLGFTGKQAIHPAQVAAIQRAFAPSPAEITRAQAILDQYESARESGRGAYGLQGADGQTEMIDAPMLLQARSILDQARASGLV